MSALHLIPPAPTVVCLCGSTRFASTFHDQNLALTLEGRIVLSIGADTKTDTEIFGKMSSDELESVKARLDELHRRKIDLASVVRFLNVGGYMGQSTQGEWVYALQQGKAIEFLEPDTLPDAAEVVMRLYPQVAAIRRVEREGDPRFAMISDLRLLPPWSEVWRILHDFEDAVATLRRDWHYVEGL